MRQIVIFGTGDMADVAHAYFTQDSAFDVVAFTVDRDHVTADQHRGLPLVAFDEVVRHYPPDRFAMFVAVLWRRMNAIRAERYRQAKDLGYELVSYVASTADVSPDVTIGDNCYVGRGNIIEPFTTIGSDVTIWSGCQIGHGSSIGDHTFIASHAVVAGDVTIEPHCFIGLNATIRDSVTIARECVVGAGTVILRNTRERQVFVASSTRLLPTNSDRLPSM